MKNALWNVIGGGTIVFCIAVPIIMPFTLVWMVNHPHQDACRAKGGYEVRTNSGSVCAKLEIIK